MVPLRRGTALGGGAFKVQYQATQGPLITSTSVWISSVTTRGDCRGREREMRGASDVGGLQERDIPPFAFHISKSFNMSWVATFSV